MAVIAPGTQIIDIYQMTEGLNTIKSGVKIGPTELRDCQNIRYFPVGGFQWRQGYVTLGNAPGTACTGLYMGRFSNGTNVAYRVRGSNIEYMTSLNGTWNDVTGALSITSGQDNLWNFAILNDIVVGVNGVDTGIQINSSNVASALSGMPFTNTASFCYTHRGYMFYLTNDRAYFSTLYDPTVVGTNNYVQPGSKQGGNLVGGVDYQNKNFLFRRHGIYAVEFSPTQVDSTGTLFPFVTSPAPIVPGVGTQSARSIVKFTTPYTHKNPGQELVFFLDQFGVPRLFDGTTTVAIGASILKSRDGSITSLSSMNMARLAYTWAINDVANNLIYLFMSSGTGTQHDTCWILDYTSSFSWSRDSYADVFNCGALFENNSGVFKPYFANYSGQVVESSNGQTDNGAAINSYARGGDLYFQHPVIRSKWLYNEIRGTTGSDTQQIQVDYYQDGEDVSSKTDFITPYKQGQAKWDAVTWDQFNWAYSGLTTKSSEINLECKTLAVKFSNSTSGNTASIEGYSLFAIPEGWKQEN